MSKVFISYSRGSAPVAASLAGDIEALGHTVWVDKELSGGQSWWDRILSTVRECDVFVFVLDPQSLDSTACKREYGYAADLGKSILPVLTADGISSNLLPSALSQIQFVDYRSRDRDAVLRLARAFTSLPPPKPLPNPLPPSPEVPLSYLGSLGERVDKAASLTYEEQSALIVDLKRSARDPETRGDALTLLHRLRKRRDLLAAVADEIDEVLKGVKSATESARVVRDAPGPAPSDTRPASPPIESADRREPIQRSARIPWSSRLKAAGIGGFAGTVLMALTIAGWGMYSIRNDWLPYSLGFGAIPWAMGGAIAAQRPRVIGVALLAAVTGFVIALVLMGSDRDAPIVAMVFGAGGGQLLGAIAGAIWHRRKRLTSATRSQ